MKNAPTLEAPRWARAVLVMAGCYNLLWGAVVVFFPAALFQWAGAEPPTYEAIWQCLGMVVGVYGVGYLIAARSPLVHWPIVLVGLMGKVLGPAGFLLAALRGQLPWSWGLTIITNDLIWWAPFGAILYLAVRAHSDCSRHRQMTLDEALDAKRSQRGATLRDLASPGPVLIVFLRHAGCTFCREMLADLKQQRDRVEQLGVEIALVHMSRPLDATRLAIRYGVEGVHLFSDPECELYEAFGLSRGNLSQLLGPTVWWRGVQAGLLRGHGLGSVQGDGFRMPGAFLMRDGEIVAACRSQTAADPIDFLALCSAASRSPQPASSTAV